MARCVVCGNEYRDTFTIIDAGGAELIFDSFECAVHRLAPVCAHCGCKIIEFGEDAVGRTYCSHCAHRAA